VIVCLEAVVLVPVSHVCFFGLLDPMFWWSVSQDRCVLL
jgi:hypothetical protein